MNHLPAKTVQNASVIRLNSDATAKWVIPVKGANIQWICARIHPANMGFVCHNRTGINASADQASIMCHNKTKQIFERGICHAAKKTEKKNLFLEGFGY